MPLNVSKIRKASHTSQPQEDTPNPLALAEDHSFPSLVARALEPVMQSQSTAIKMLVNQAVGKMMGNDDPKLRTQIFQLSWRLLAATAGRSDLIDEELPMESSSDAVNSWVTNRWNGSREVNSSETVVVDVETQKEVTAGDLRLETTLASDDDGTGEVDSLDL